MSNTQIPLYRGERKDNGEYITGYYAPKVNCFDGKSIGGEDFKEVIISDYGIKHQIDPSTLSIQMPKRNFFMSLDIKTGKGGDKVGENDVLVWNGDMMNCSILELREDGSIYDYRIDLDNSDFDRLIPLGIHTTEGE